MTRSRSHPRKETFADEEATGLAEGMRYPMFVLPVRFLLGMSGAPEPHQTLREKGMLRKWREGMFVIFVSHQWVSSNHPDPQGRQLAVLREALRNIIEQKVSVATDVASTMIFNSKQSLTAEEIENLEHAYIWFDYFSIPQPGVAWKHALEQQGDAQDVTKDMIAAVNSIPAYVEQCSIFLVNSPPLTHESTGNICNTASWQDRGWCRVELGCQALRQQEGRTLVISSPTQIAFMPSVDWMFSPPGSGSFTVESDKQVIYPVMKQILDKKIEICHTQHQSKAKSSLFKYRFFTAMQSNLLEGLSPIDVDAEPSQHTLVSQFLAKYQFQCASDVGEKGWGPLMFAAIEGNLPVMQALVSAGAQVNSRTLEDNAFCYMKKGSTPLMVAAFLNGHLECMAYLMDCKADVAAEDSLGSLAIHYATWADRPQAVELLIDRGSAIEKPDMFGSRPLHTAALFGRARAAEALVKRGATVHPFNGFGCTPLQVLATFHSDVDIARLMISNKAVVNYRQYPQAVPIKILCRLCQARAWFKKQESAFVRLFAEIPGINAIGLAAMKGMQELCEVLIKEGNADPFCKNDRGHDAFDLAIIGGHSELPSLLRSYLTRI